MRRPATARLARDQVHEVRAMTEELNRRRLETAARLGREAEALMTCNELRVARLRETAARPASGAGECEITVIPENQNGSKPADRRSANGLQKAGIGGFPGFMGRVTANLVVFSTGQPCNRPSAR